MGCIGDGGKVGRYICTVHAHYIVRYERTESHIAVLVCVAREMGMAGLDLGLDWIGIELHWVASVRVVVWVDGDI